MLRALEGHVPTDNKLVNFEAVISTLKTDLAAKISAVDLYPEAMRAVLDKKSTDLVSDYSDMVIEKMKGKLSKPKLFQALPHMVGFAVGRAFNDLYFNDKEAPLHSQAYLKANAELLSQVLAEISKKGPPFTQTQGKGKQQDIIIDNVLVQAITEQVANFAKQPSVFNLSQPQLQELGRNIVNDFTNDANLIARHPNGFKETIKKNEELDLKVGELKAKLDNHALINTLELALAEKIKATTGKVFKHDDQTKVLQLLLSSAMPLRYSNQKINIDRLMETAQKKALKGGMTKENFVNALRETNIAGVDMQKYAPLPQTPTQTPEMDYNAMPLPAVWPKDKMQEKRKEPWLNIGSHREPQETKKQKSIPEIGSHRKNKP